MFAVCARVMQKDQGEQVAMKSKGVNIPKLEKSHSIVNVTQSEALVREGFGIIFAQFKRYIKFMKEFEPIDWEFYVTK